MFIQSQLAPYEAVRITTQSTPYPRCCRLFNTNEPTFFDSILVAFVFDGNHLSSCFRMIASHCLLFNHRLEVPQVSPIRARKHLVPVPIGVVEDSHIGNIWKLLDFELLQAFSISLNCEPTVFLASFSRPNHS